MANPFLLENQMRKTRYILLIGMLVSIAACDKSASPESSTAEPALFEAIDSDYSGVTFVNHVENQRNFNIFKYRNFYNGGGVAIGDINNDDLPDLYFTGNMVSNRLYLNKGDFQFEDITEQAGVAGMKPWSTGVAMVDINDDGLLDIYVSNAGNLEGNNHDNDLYINNGDLTFTESAEKYNLAKSGFSTHASFFDYDLDGDLDAYLLNNSNIPVSSLGYASDREKRASQWEDVPEIFRGVGDVLLRNDNGRYVDVSEEAGIYGSLIGFGLGVFVTDINQDNFPDIYVSNDFYERDYLYINQQDGTFSEEIREWTSHLCLSAMGVDFGDINNDGLVDIFITDMMPEEDQRIKSVMEFESYNVFKLKQSRDFYQQYIQNTLQVNNGNNTFSEIAYFSGIAKTDWSWAGMVFDMDNDGYKDIYVTNGIIHDLTDIDFVDFFANEVIQNTVLTGEKEEVTAIIEKMPVVKLSNYTYRNNGDFTFKDVAEDWGLGIPSFSNGGAYADLDNDGDLDLVVNNVNMEAFVFKNKSREISDNHYLKLSLKGKEGNGFAIGSKVRLYFKDQIITQDLMPFRGFQSSVDYPLILGLGSITQLDSLEVIWPDGKITTKYNVKADQSIVLNQGEGINNKNFSSDQADTDSYLSEKTELIPTAHKEDLYNDFDHEGLIERHLSKEGPALAIGDVNSDGNEDFFLGGAKGQPGQIYFFSENGLIRKESDWFLIDAGFEDTAAEFVDVDNDGDLDLVVGTGGNSKEDKNYYFTRLYINDGSGSFTRTKQELPSTSDNISVLRAHDFDDDGDMDLFVGSRSVPGVYGVNPGHLLLANDGSGNFKDVTERYAYDLRAAGMVTDALWVDIDGDNKKDLVVTADWGTVQVFKNNGRRLAKFTTSLDSLGGWWFDIEAADLDSDGDFDLIIGNKGLNIPYLATEESPLRMYINDFDKNGTIEQITTVYREDGDYPIHMRKDVTAQMPHLKKENLKASDYARRTIHELFSPEVMSSTLVKTVNLSSSVIAENLGNGVFKIKELPPRVQWSCVCGIVCEDVNQDNIPDLLLAGNMYELKPQFSRQDANFGNLLIGNGTMEFDWTPYDRSGFFLREEVRDLGILHTQSGRKYVITAVNNGESKLFEIK
jgi:hypothetical protein